MEKRYDARGRLSLVSNPYVKTDNPESTETPVWTETGYDALDRPVLVRTPDGAVVQTSYSGG